MKISDRFTDYGLIGGFFWLLQFSVWGVFGFPRVPWNMLLVEFKTVLSSIPEAIPVAAALFGALAIILIFTTGLLLDLLSSAFYAASDGSIFIFYLRRNKVWLKRLVDQNIEYIQEDWETLLNASSPPSKVLHLLFSWSALYRNLESIGDATTVREPFKRFQAFLLSYVLTSGGENNELLSTQMSLWSLARAIAMAMAFGALATQIQIMFAEPMSSFWLLFVVQVALIIATFVVARSAYARVCSTLFALAYIIISGASSQQPARTSPSSPA